MYVNCQRCEEGASIFELLHQMILQTNLTKAKQLHLKSVMMFKPIKESKDWTHAVTATNSKIGEEPKN